MLILFDSKTGNVKRFIQKLNLPSQQIHEDLVVDEPYVLVTYTTGFGQVPEKVSGFLKRNHSFLCGVAASGNRNWGEGFAKSADRISAEYKIPVVTKFELSGTKRDVESFLTGVSALAAH
ncbi:class Ib ribonucleoside-diphosphate reductase assembly flavoprotein NrdI [Paenibacillus turpanensis]|uniref:class Ib ribonucleoside-diphosphate reductase assembly flavoprotein NrdI n=1 Tax=Paenibacillus turpanensis TaxID=2689078 RepID=UPI00140C4168|nr:class Ib ribonucleoside-diphosphate reductase assembly flavoprotein NrdI [Paenibacillus turpanensis]